MEIRTSDVGSHLFNLVVGEDGRVSNPDLGLKVHNVTRGCIVTWYNIPIACRCRDGNVIVLIPYDYENVGIDVIRSLFGHFSECYMSPAHTTTGCAGKKPCNHIHMMQRTITYSARQNMSDEMDEEFEDG